MKVRITAAASAVIIAGCGAALTGGYIQRAEGYRQALGTGETPGALADLASQRDSSDGLLALQERGRIAQIAGNFLESRLDFEAAIERYQKLDERAKLSASQIGGQALALLGNDTTVGYEGEEYERVFVHHHQALNYLFLGQTEAALIEVRRAGNEQKLAMDRRDAKLAEAEEESRKDSSVSVDRADDFRSKMAGMDPIVGRVKNSFQNAYVFYVSGVLYEMAGEANSAYIDYKKALEIFPGNPVLKADVLRLARTLAMGQDAEALKGVESLPPLSKKSGQGHLVVLHESGFAPKKSPVSITIPSQVSLGGVGFVTIEFPIYDAAGLSPDAGPLRVNVSGQSGQTSTVVDIPALAAQALKDRSVSMMIRVAARAIAKETARRQAEQQNPLLGLAAQVYNLASESADLRSWLTLPAQAGIHRRALPAGTHTVSLASKSGQQDVPVKIEAGKITVLRLVDADGRLYVQQSS